MSFQNDRQRRAVFAKWSAETKAVNEMDLRKDNIENLWLNILDSDGALEPHELYKSSTSGGLPKDREGMYKTQAEVGKVFCLTRNSISAIERKALSKLRNKLEKIEKLTLKDFIDGK